MVWDLKKNFTIISNYLIWNINFKFVFNSYYFDLNSRYFIKLELILNSIIKYLIFQKGSISIYQKKYLLSEKSVPKFVVFFS